MMAKGAQSPGSGDIVYASLILRAFRMEKGVPRPVLLGQLVERLVPLPWEFEGS